MAPAASNGRRASFSGGGGPFSRAGGRETLSLKGHWGPVYGVAFSPDGRRLASGSLDTMVKIWDAAGGQETLSLQGHTGRVTGVAFSPDGLRLASASWDQTVRVWEAQPVSADDLRRREIVNLLRDLFNRLALRSEVVARLQKDATLDAPTGAAAVPLAQTVP